jgi:hypothetical protein
VPSLKSAPGRRPVAIFDEIRRRHPEIGVGVRRTLERRIRAWRALNGAEKGGIPDRGAVHVCAQERTLSATRRTIRRFGVDTRSRSNFVAACAR